MAIQQRQGHHRLGTVHACSAGPEIGAGVERRQATVQPGVAQQCWESIHALQQRWVALDPCRILRNSNESNLLQGCLQRLGREFGSAASTGHRGLRGHGCGVAKPLHEALVNAAFPLPEK